MEEAAFNSLSIQEQQTIIQLTGHYYQALLSTNAALFCSRRRRKATKEVMIRFENITKILRG